jgi:ADP-ribosylglycohydrolase
MKHRNELLLLRMAQADAYGGAAEEPRDEEDDAILLRLDHYPGRKDKPHRWKRYSDDGQMAVGVAETLLQGPPWLPTKFASAFLATYRRDPRKGYSPKFQEILDAAQDTDDFQLRVAGHPSERNGACMRAPPIGVLPNIADVLEVARVQAIVTHDTPMGIFSAQAVALMSHFALYYDDGFDRLEAFCRECLPDYHFPEAPRGPISPSQAIYTVHAVHWLLTSSHSLEDIMRKVILLRGDTDTVAAIAWGIASCRMHDELPAFWEADLEPDGPYGPVFLRDLGTRLMDRFDR